MNLILNKATIKLLAWCIVVCAPTFLLIFVHLTFINVAIVVDGFKIVIFKGFLRNKFKFILILSLLLLTFLNHRLLWWLFFLYHGLFLWFFLLWVSIGVDILLSLLFKIFFSKFLELFLSDFLSDGHDLFIKECLSIFGHEEADDIFNVMLVHANLNYKASTQWEYFII